jgi:hypothetical protein
MLLACLDKDTNTYKPVTAKAGCEREVYLESELKNRRYILYVKAEWVKWNDRDIFISTYGETAIQIKQCPKIPNLLSDYYMEISKSNKNWKPYQ